jgi:hypothetical protein
LRERSALNSRSNTIIAAMATAPTTKMSHMYWSNLATTITTRDSTTPTTANSDSRWTPAR